jgi:uncharacterized membrane protein
MFMTQKYTTNTVFLALTAMWVAVVLVCAWIPAYPVLGTPAVITVANIVSSALTAPILGPVWGALAGFTYGWLIPYVNPTSSIGLLTFLSPTMAAVMAGLVLFNRWKEATLILSAQIAIWFLHPFAWYQAMPIVTWEYWLAMALIIVPPIRKWIINAFKSRNPATLPIALWCLAWIARAGGDVVTGNNIGVWVNGWGVPSMYPYWAPMTLYYAIADSLGCLSGALIGTIALPLLKAANLRFIAVDFLESKTQP